jgi:integrase
MSEGTELVLEPLPPLREVVRMPSLFDLAKEFLAERRTELTESSLGRVGYCVKNLELFLAGRPLSRPNLLAYRDHLIRTREGAGGGVEWAGVKQFCSWLVMAGYCRNSPANGIRPPPAKKPVFHPPVMDREYRILLDHDKDPNSHWLYCLMFHTGMALVDAAGLLWEEVDMERWIIQKVRQKIRNYDKPCVIPVDPCGELATLIRDRATKRDKDRYLWPNMPNVEYVHPHAWLDVSNRRFIQRMNGALNKSGLRARGFTPHSFRRGLITRLANGGINPLVGCQIVGHKDPKMFMSYVDRDPELIRESMGEALTKYSERNSK